MFRILIIFNRAILLLILIIENQKSLLNLLLNLTFIRGFLTTPTASIIFICRNVICILYYRVNTISLAFFFLRLLLSVILLQRMYIIQFFYFNEVQKPRCLLLLFLFFFYLIIIIFRWRRQTVLLLIVSIRFLCWTYL